MNVVAKAFGVLVVVLGYIAAATASMLLPAKPRQRLEVWLVSATSIFLLKILSVKVVYEGTLGGGSGGVLIVSNHISYVDVLVIASRCPAVFVTSEEMRLTPVLGFLCTLGGTLFVERRNPARIKRELAALKGLLELGLHVCLFPEGTSSDGSDILPFRSSLLEVACLAEAPVVPVGISYSDPRIAYHGGHVFGPHLFRFLGVRGTVARVSVGERVSARGIDRKTLTKLCRDQIIALRGRHESDVSS